VEKQECWFTNLHRLLLMEDVKHEQLLMLTFSRAAATEFKKRLLANLLVMQLIILK
jgi:ATP-dependent exoDNAse (exonuclease V) beta subunit